MTEKSDTGHISFSFSCSDTGIGMSEQFAKRAFEPFSQEAESARSVFSGMGLGLAITKEIVDELGGRISLETKENEGTTFMFIIRLEASNTEKQSLITASEDSIEGLHILIAEDNELNMEIAAGLLEEKGAHIIRAYNGRTALRVFEESAPGEINVILMDIMMPELDGLGAARAIRALDRSDAESVPIFAISANSFSDDIKKSLDAGMNEHLSKPIRIDEVTAMILKYKRKPRNQAKGTAAEPCTN